MGVLQIRRGCNAKHPEIPHHNDTEVSEESPKCGYFGPNWTSYQTIVSPIEFGDDPRPRGAEKQARASSSTFS